MWKALLQPNCLGCGDRGGPLCGQCADAVCASAVAVEDRDGLVRAWAAPHVPPTAWLVVALKDRGARSLSPLLASLLSRPLARVLSDLPGAAPTALVPIPQRPRNRLRRPEDPVLRLAREVAALLAAAGEQLRVTPVLSWVRGGPDQSGLGADQRRGNVQFAMRAAPSAAPGTCVLVDDVVTTGSTALEAARALRAAGWQVPAVVSITHPVRGPGLEPEPH